MQFPCFFHSSFFAAALKNQLDRLSTAIFKVAVTAKAIAFSRTLSFKSKVQREHADRAGNNLMVIDVQSPPEKQGSTKLIEKLMSKKISVYYQQVIPYNITESQNTNFSLASTNFLIK